MPTINNRNVCQCVTRREGDGNSITNLGHLSTCIKSGLFGGHITTITHLHLKLGNKIRKNLTGKPQLIIMINDDDDNSNNNYHFCTTVRSCVQLSSITDLTVPGIVSV